MTSPRAGFYQNELRDLRGNAITTATVDVFLVGTLTPATLYATSDRSQALTNPLPAAVGLNRPGKDEAGNIAFYAEDTDADGLPLEYDVRATYSGGQFTMRAKPAPAPPWVPEFQVGPPACSQFFAITAGQLLEMRDIATVQPYGSQGATAKGMLCGVALNGVSSSSREYVIVATKGHDITVQSDSAVGITDVLVPSTASPTKVVGLQSDGTTATLTKPVVGRPYIATGAAGTVRAHVRFP